MRVVDTNWLYHLVDAEGNKAWVMDTPFYRLEHNLKSPIHKGHLDALQPGMWVEAELIKIDGTDVVVQLRY